MFILLERRDEIRQAHAQLLATIQREFTQTAIRDIGWQGGRRHRAVLQTDGTYWFWSSDHKDKTKNPRSLNWFGLIEGGPGVSISLEVNTPYVGRNDLIAGFFARNTANGKVYLFHSGRIGGGAEGVKKDALIAWADLSLFPVSAADGTYKEGILVMPVTGKGALRPAISYVQSVIEFKNAIRSGDAQTTDTKEKQRRLRQYFDEFFGRKRVRSPERDVDYISRHGEIVRALWNWRQSKGLKARQTIVKTGLLDLGVSEGTQLTEVYEVKTATTRSDIYTGIGQLMVHGDTAHCKRILVVPANPPLAHDLVSSLSRIGIGLMRYQLTDSDVSIV